MSPTLKRILVVPGTSLVGLEILQSLAPLPGFEVHGAGTDTAAAQRAAFAQYDYLPRVDHPDFAALLLALVERDSIDYVYPANDLAITAITGLAAHGFKVISHPADTVRIAGSKIATHDVFVGDGITPRRYRSAPPGESFPLFSKPDVGHSAIGAVVVSDVEALIALGAGSADFWTSHLVTELLTGEEVTVDCFSTVDGGLIYVAPRTRDVPEGGVSVVTTDAEDPELSQLAALIATRLEFSGPWFFQAKRDTSGEFRLMEIGARLAGASAIRRAQGVNLAQLAVLAADGEELSVYRSPFRFTARRVDGIAEVESSERFVALYVDLDDTLILNGDVNVQVEELARSVKARGLHVAIVTRHRKDPLATLREYGLDGIFDNVFHATRGEPKASFIHETGNVVLIDDSFSERRSTSSRSNILAVDASAAPQLRRLFNVQ